MVKKLIYISLLSAISFLLMYTFSIPIIPNAPYLKFEPSEVPAILATFLIGPKAGVIVILLKDLLYFFLRATGPFGPLSDFIAASTFVYVTALFCKNPEGTLQFVKASFLGLLARVIIMVPVNLIILQLEFGMPVSSILGIMIPAILPFNLLKAGVNSIITFVIYKPIARFLHK